jgi:hypothetical protein
MSVFDLKFTTSSAADSGSYKLLELPPEICSLIESSAAGEEAYVPGPHSRFSGVNVDLDLSLKAQKLMMQYCALQTRHTLYVRSSYRTRS